MIICSSNVYTLNYKYQRLTQRDKMGTDVVQGTIKAQSTIQFEKLIQHNFIVQIPTSKQESQNIKCLTERSTGNRYLLKKLQTDSQEQASLYNDIISRKVKQRCSSVIPLQEYHFQRVRGTCSAQFIYYLFFKVGELSSLRTQFVKRQLTNRQFTQQELIEGIKSFAKAVLWLQTVHKQSNGQINCRICPQNALYHNGTFCLSDPWISDFQPQQLFKYSSPERLLLMNDQLDEIDWAASQMFGVGLLFLEAAKLGKTRKFYAKNKINLSLLQQEIEECGYNQLKKLLRSLLLQGADKRRQFLDCVQGGAEKIQKEKIGRFQKHKTLSKVHSCKKIKLIKNCNNENSSISSQQTAKQVQPGLAPSFERQPLQQANNNSNRLPSITFNYIPFLNKVRFQLRPIDNQIHSVHKCIQNINRNLASIQTLVSQEIYSQEMSRLQQNIASQNVAESKIVEESADQAQLQQAGKKSLPEHYKVEIPHTHTEQSDSKNSKQLFQKDSLHALMEQFHIEEQHRLTESYNQTTYTVNLNQPATQPSQPTQKEEKDQSSLDVANPSLDDNSGYIFKMQGTQLQAVSKLTIPEEEAEEEQSCDEGQKVPKGEYVVQKHEKGGTYKGYMHNNKRNGLGTFIYLQGGYYEGNWKDNKMNGYGKIYYDSGQLAYEGLWYQDQIHGRGKLFNDTPQPLVQPFDYTHLDHEHYHLYELCYEGDFSHDLKEGFGKLTLSNGECYSGQFHENNPHGKGYFSGVNIAVYGQWQDGKFMKAL